MKSALASQITKALLLSFLATSFVACKTVEQGSDFSSRSPASSLVSGKASLQQSRSANPEGPGDSGGGNGVGGKAYESYIVSLLDLPEYQKYIVPIFNQMDAANPGQKIPTARLVAESKTWYIAPVKLSPIDKSVLGVSFSADKTEQLAIQTATSIWIDQKKWDGMKEEKDRAMLLLHEITMQIYLMKFENFQSFCKFSQTECPLPELWNETKSFAPTKRHALAARDYDNIRAVTFWIATNGKTASKEKFHAVFAANDFDARLFGTKALENSKRLQAEQTLSYDFTTVKSALSRSQILNKMPDKCYALNSKVEFDCTVTTTPVESKYGQAASIKISAPNFSRETIIYYASGTSEKMRDYHDSMSMFALSNMSCQVGSVSNSVYVYAFGDEKAKPAAMEILSVTMQPLVTYASEGQMASAAQPKVTSLETDTIIAYRSDVDFELGLLKYATGLINQSTANTTRPCN
jgi:hypothetical protein